jgi:hypothetical protein
LILKANRRLARLAARAAKNSRSGAASFLKKMPRLLIVTSKGFASTNGSGPAMAPPFERFFEQAFGK